MEDQLIDKLIIIQGQETRVEDVTESKKPHHYRIHLYNGEAFDLFYKNIVMILSDGDYLGEVQTIDQDWILNPSKGLFTTPAII